MFDGMELKISRGNSKIGQTPNLSLPPIVTCRDNVPCARDCYAKRSYIQYPRVRECWGGNLKLYLEKPEKFFSDLTVYLSIKRPRRFRLFVGGDFPDAKFFDKMLDIVFSYPDINFLCFTKRYEFAIRWQGYIPSNYKLVLSMWPGLDLPEGYEKFPTAWLSEDDRFNFDTYIKCKGKCSECGYQCWSAINPELPVVFDKH